MDLSLRGGAASVCASLTRTAHTAAGAAARAPAFVHAGLGLGASTVVAAVLVPAGSAAAGVAAAAVAAALAAAVWGLGARRIDARPGAARLRFVAAQATVIAVLVMTACGAAALFRITVPGVFLAAAATGAAAVLALALAFLDGSRLAALADAVAAIPVPRGWAATRIAHVHRVRLQTALTVDAATARRRGQPSLASRLVPAAHDGKPGGAPLTDDPPPLRRRFAAEARLRVLGLVPIAALAVPYAAVAALAAAVLAPPPPPAIIAAAAPGMTAPAAGHGGGDHGGGHDQGGGNDQGGAGRGAGAGSTATGNAGGSQAPGGAGTGGTGAAGQAQPGAAGDRGTAAPEGTPTPAAGPATAPRSGAGDAAAASAGADTSADGHAGNDRGDGAAATADATGTSSSASSSSAGAAGLPATPGHGSLPGPGSGEAGDGSGRGRGAASPPRPFTPGTAVALPPDEGRKIVVTGMAEGFGRPAGGPPAVPDSALARGTNLPPAPLLEWPPLRAANAGPAAAPRPYRPRQPLPAWTAPLVPGAAPERP